MLLNRRRCRNCFVGTAVLFLSRCGNESDQHFPSVSARSTGSTRRRLLWAAGSGGVVWCGVVVLLVGWLLLFVRVEMRERGSKRRELREVGSYVVVRASPILFVIKCYHLLSNVSICYFLLSNVNICYFFAIL